MQDQTLLISGIKQCSCDAKSDQWSASCELLSLASQGVQEYSSLDQCHASGNAHFVTV